jgi:hypothetical protein
MRGIGKFFKKESHLQVGYELLHDSLPCDETLDEDVRGAEVTDVLDERLRTGDSLGPAC